MDIAEKKRGKELRMAEFQTIETQEQLDAVISDRINQEKEALVKQYEGYLSPDDAKAKREEYEKQIGNLQTALNDANEKIANHDREIAERDSKIKGYEIASLKTKIAQEVGLSYEAVDFLKGEDENSIRVSADSLKTLMGNSKNEPPLASGEEHISGADTALRNTLKNLTSKGE